MKQPQTQSVTSRVLLALTLAVIGLTGLSGLAEAATCFTCHAPVGSATDIRPVESTYRNITTGSIKGSHAKHIPAATIDANTCTPCHGPLVVSTNHRSGFINVTSTTAPGLSYSKGSKFPQSGANNLTLGTCSTASCHANVYASGTITTPVWGTAVANCTACHTTPIGANGPATGSHTNTAGHAVACISCHAAGTTATVPPTVGHNDGNIDVANVGYATLDKAKGTAGTTCSAASCHASPVAAGFVTTPAWGTTGNGCAACHMGVNAITAAGPATGSHALTGHAAACTACHAAGTAATVAPSTGHNDGNIDVANVGYATLNKVKGTAGTTCSAASCHASPVSAALVITPAWGTTGNGCAACHSGANLITANGPATGSHTNTAGHAVACISCHNSGTTATTSPSVGHTDGDIDIANVGYATLNKVKGSAGVTCSAASCHASPVAAATIVTPAWGTTGNGCAACHSGVNAITATGPATGSHALPGHAASCTSCHNAGTTATTTPSIGHNDGDIDVANVSYATLNKTKGTAGVTCSTASCHVSPISTAFVVTPAWGATGNGCAACHSGANAITATGPATGSHALTGHAAACISCHAAGTTATSAPSTGHNDGHIDVANVGYATLNKVKGSAGVTCSTASCHASPVSAATVVTPAWGTTGNGCAACHSGANAITATGPATGSHALTGHAAACTSCHAAGTTATTTPSTGHNDGNIDVANVGYATLNKAKGTAGVTCSAASCHASPVSATLVVTPAWGTSGNGCAACHSGANLITATGPATGSHALTGHAAACISCHAAGTTQTTSPSVGHADGDIDIANVGYATLNKVKGSAGVTCSAASCHASPVSATLVVTPAWGTSGNGCAACHSGANLITATGPATGSHALTGHAAACISCHAAGTTQTTAPSAGHADGDIDIANVGYATLNKVKGSAGVTCSTASCHASPVAASTVVTPAWGTTGNGCAACHTGANAITATGPATGSHALSGHAAACISCHAAGTTATTTPTTGHNDGNIDVANVGYATLNKVKGSAGVTCSAASCHASPVAAALVVTPAWGTTGSGCAACHTGVNVITATGPATGSHTTAAGHAVACTTCHAAGTTATSAPSTGHNDGNIDVANVGYATLNKTKGTAGVSCSTAVCHGSTSPAWGANTANDTCTKCHGTGTVTVTVANRAVVAPSDAAGVGTGKVSANAKIGAHETHLKFLNNLSAQGTQDSRCTDCHGALPVSGSHANGSSTPVFQGLATNNGAITGASFTAGNCSNTYCHNPAAAVGGTLNSANAGTGVTPSWTNAAYIADGTLKTQANCGTCHKSPGNAGFTASISHDAAAMPLGINTDCSSCHGHNGGAGGAVGQQHMDGIKWGNGACDVCHGYPPVASMIGLGVVGNFENAKLQSYAGGGGHHQTHLLATVKASEGFTPCLPCHPSGFHNSGNGVVAKANVNVNDAADLTFRFDETRAKRYNVASMTCSNVSCHFQPTPAW